MSLRRKPHTLVVNNTADMVVGGLVQNIDFSSGSHSVKGLLYPSSFDSSLSEFGIECVSPYNFLAEITDAQYLIVGRVCSCRGHDFVIKTNPKEFTAGSSTNYVMVLLEKLPDNNVVVNA
jgi:hypothetical protein